MAELPLSPQGRRYNATPSKPALTTPGFPSHIIYLALAEPKAKGSLTGTVGPTKDQGAQGSCDGNSNGSLGERLYLRWRPGVPFVKFSAAYSYAQERLLDGTFPDDAGSTIETSTHIVEPRYPGGTGWCPESLMPYDQDVCNVKPSAAQIAEAAKYPGGAYHSIGNNIANIKSCIDSDYSFLIGIAVFDSFEADSTASSGLVPFPDTNAEKLLGYHALHCGMEYDDSLQCPGSANPGAVKFQNSWGTGWGTKCALSGEGGFGWLSYDFLANSQLTTDVRLGHLGKAW
jgi:hypothetical protein